MVNLPTYPAPSMCFLAQERNKKACQDQIKKKKTNKTQQNQACQNRVKVV